MELLLFFFVFFCEVGPNWDPRTQAHWPIAPIVAVSLLYFSNFVSFTEAPKKEESESEDEDMGFGLFD